MALDTVIAGRVDVLKQDFLARPENSKLQGIMDKSDSARIQVGNGLNNVAEAILADQAGSTGVTRGDIRAAQIGLQSTLNGLYLDGLGNGSADDRIASSTLTAERTVGGFAAMMKQEAPALAALPGQIAAKVAAMPGIVRNAMGVPSQSSWVTEKQQLPAFSGSSGREEVKR